MTTAYHNLAGGDFTQDWSNTGLITANDDWSKVPSIVGFLAEASSASSFDPASYLTDAGFTIDVVANQPATANNGGVVEVDQGIANPAVGIQGSGAADVAGLVLYLNAAGRQNIHFTANLRDLDASADASVQKVVVQYRVGETGAWTNIATVADASDSGATKVTPIDVTLPDAANNQAQVQVRILTGNASGNDELIGVDDLHVTSAPAGGTGTPQHGSFAAADVSVLEGDGGGATALTFTVARSGGSEGAATVDYSFTLPGGTGGASADDFATAPAGGTLSFADGETSKTITVQVAADGDVEPTETFTLNLSNPTGGATIADASATGTILSDDLTLTRIHDIQGTAFFSPILAAEGITAFNQASTAQVTVRGVVTAIDSYPGSDGIQGFYISEEVSDWDNDARTSEGIFVRTSGAVSGLTVGETVTLTANVMEFQNFTNLNRTMLVNPVNIAQGNDTVALPTFVIDGSEGHRIPTGIISDDNPVFTDPADDANDTFDPENDALDFYETIEGMRVTMTNVKVADGFVSGSDDFVYFNAYSADNADPALLNSRGGYTITGNPQFYPYDDGNPAHDVKYGGATVTDGAQHGDIIELDFSNVGRGGTSAFDQDLTMGDSLGDVSGIVDFDFGVTKLYVTDPLDPAKVAALDDTTPIQEVTELAGDDRSLRVATFNVENLSPVGTTFSTNNGVEVTTQAKYDKLAANIANNLKSPDIIVIEEVQDNNGVTTSGGTDASTTWAQLVSAVNAATGKHYQWVDEAPATANDVGGAPGGNIRVGFLYDTDRVSLGNLAADASIADRRAYTDVIGDGVRTAGDLIAVDDTNVGVNPSDWSGTRRSIVGEFNFHGQTVYVFGSHLPSKGGSDDPYEIGQNNAAGLPANGDWATRNTLAQDVWAVQNKVTTNIGASVVSGGDFNEFWFNRPLEVLTGYANPNGTANTAGAKYTNLMVSELAPAERFSYDFDGRSETLDTLIVDQKLAAVASFDPVHINTGYNDRTGAVNPASSDHDPSLASFDLRSYAETLNGTAGDDAIQGFGGNDAINGGAGSDTAVYAGAWTGYSVTNSGTTVTDIDATDGDEGTDTLTGVETLRFNGANVAAADAVNDAPIGQNDTNAGDAIIEDGDGAAAGNVLANDTDADLALGVGETLRVTGARAGTEAAGGALTGVSGTTVVNGTYGQLTINADGSYGYALDNARAATQALNAGQTATESFTYQVADAHGLTDTAQLQLSIQGARDVADKFTLQLLHFSDAEAGELSLTTAKNLAALVDAFEDDYANSITFAGGDDFLPGPFLAAGTDPSVLPVLNQVSGSTIAAGTNLPIAAVDIQILNQIGVQVSAIGNHEFDLGSRVLRDAITPNAGAAGYVGANFAYLSANLDFSGDADLAPRYSNTTAAAGLEEASTLKGRIAPSAVITQGGEKIGFVGATTQVLEQISSPTGTEVKGFPTGPGANGEVNDMALLAQQLQPVIDDLIAQGVNKIVLMSHLQDYHLEEQLAPLLRGVDVIASAGSHARFGDGNDQAVDFPGHSADFAETYPIVTAGADGNTTVIVNTDSEYTYLGRLVLDFDADGHIITDSLTANSGINGAYATTTENVADAWNDHDGDLSDTAFAEGTRGEQVEDLTNAVGNVIEVKDGNIFGYTNVYLEGERQQVRTQETNLGDLSADANAAVAREALGLSADEAVVSIKNGGGIRAQIGTIENAPDGINVIKLPPEVGGEVSQLDVENSLRFDNKLMTFDTTAQGLLNILNSPNTLAPNNGGFIQIGGVRFSYDPTKAAGQRVQDVVLVNEAGQITAKIADNGAVVAGAPSLIHGIVLNFTANGGDGYLFKQNADNFRYVKTDGTLSAAVDESLDFTATTTINAYVGSGTNLLGEQAAFEEYLHARYGTHETAYNQADTDQTGDIRIQNQAVRADTVLQGTYLRAGDALNNTVTGDASAEVLKGYAGNDKLNGGDGDDVLVGGLGADTLTGGNGIDTASYVDAGSGVAVDLVSGRGSFGEAAGDRLLTIENLTGSAYGDVLMGNAKANVIHGGGGDDRIEGGGGADELYGDAGNDTFVLANNERPTLIDGGDGIDTILASQDGQVVRPFAISGIEVLSADGYSDVTIEGTSAADTINLGALTTIGISAVRGGGGNDTIVGSLSDDSIYGDAGADTLSGGQGNDLLVGGLGADILAGGAGNDVFLFAKTDSGKTLATADHVLDFQAGADRIDLSSIDANSANGAGDDAFSFIGENAFSRTAGELRVEVSGNDLIVSGDWNGDAKADFLIVLEHQTTLAAADVVL